MLQNFYEHEFYFSYNTIKMFVLDSNSIYTEYLYFSFISNLSAIPLLPITLASAVS